MNIIEISFEDSRYPDELKQIKNPPKKPYCIGNIDLLKNRKVALVGSRKCTAYGKTVTNKIGEKLSRNNVTIVSGLARGIDREAHLGSLMGRGSSIAVVATAVDQCYPASNRDLYNRLIKEGLIISENPLGHICKKYDFPNRNRIISGISEAVIVSEAPLRSGALITAEMAVEQGKEVYAVPGNITSFFSIGCNKLIRDGANIISVIDDIFMDLKINISHESMEIQQLGMDEKIVYDIIKKNGEVSMEEIFQKTEFDQAKLAGIITVMEIKGIITSSMGKFFVEIL